MSAETSVILLTCVPGILIFVFLLLFFSGAFISEYGDSYKTAQSRVNRHKYPENVLYEGIYIAEERRNGRTFDHSKVDVRIPNTFDSFDRYTGKRNESTLSNKYNSDAKWLEENGPAVGVNVTRYKKDS